ncbi:MAG: V-type ATP synthase subunit D [Candidatus Saelkia tenebricola]|nr:V-type ATP synthase subunit D [Candidatus Saelkia tenebricola]
MAKVKLTKNELKQQKEFLSRFHKYLPMLLLKKQQLQVEISKISQKSNEIKITMDGFQSQIEEWIDVFSEDVEISKYFKIKRIVLEQGNIAGIDIPIYQDVEFIDSPYDFYCIPLWVDKGIEVLKEVISLKTQLVVLDKQKDVLRKELHIATQRVNLFEKVKIPQAKENIRLIRIFLGDMFTAEVVRGKIAKEKLERKKHDTYV